MSADLNIITNTIMHGDPHPSLPVRLDQALQDLSSGEVLVVEGDTVMAWTPGLGAQLRLPEGAARTGRLDQLPASLQQIVREAGRLLKPITGRRVLLENSSVVFGPF